MRRGVVALMGWLAISARAGTLDVPAQYATIQAAVDAAAPGDTILVQPGTYPEALVLPLKALTLLAPGGAAATVIDATGLSGSAIDIPSLAEAPILIEGFTLTGGTGTPGGFGETYGGGLHVAAIFSDVVLRACVITGNSARQGGGTYGVVRLEQCTIDGNVADDGGGVAAVGQERSSLIGCVVSDNVATTGNGGGIRGYALLEDTVISGNSALLGGGLYGPAESQEWKRAVFSGNVAQNGGGAYLFITFSHEVSGATFLGNASSGLGGSLVIASCDPLAPNVVRDCSFLGNTATGGPRALQPSLCVPPNALLLRCTFQDEVVDGALVIDSCILRGVPAPILSADEVRYSNVQGGWPGTGNIDADPLFADVAAGDLHLLPGSPCRNAGDPAAALAPGAADLDGDPRILEGRVDMGADEFADDCNASGVLDWQELQAGTSADCDANGLPDECEPFVDCNLNGVRDACDIAAGTSSDCNANGEPDECEPFADCNGNGVLDACEGGDCNGNGLPDACDLAAGTSLDSDGNGVPDECHVILLVPTDHPTLQAAVDVAAPGDTILLEPGLHTGPGNHDVLLDKALLVAGTAGAAECVIDAAQAGRVVLVEGAAVTLRGLTLRGGLAGNPGGGALLAQAGAGVALQDCVLSGNAAPAQSGGALRARNGATLDLVRCVVADNQAGFGGALDLLAGSADLRGCTLSGNLAQGAFGAGVGDSLRVLGGGLLVLRDTIVRDGPGGAAAGIHLQGAGTAADIAYCDVEGGQAGVAITSGAMLAWGAGNLDAEPIFKDAAGGDFRLSGGSPCIDSGDPAGAPDADGTAPDMGAMAFTPFEDLGFALAGAGGEPVLAGAGKVIAGDPLTVTLTGAAPGAPCTLVLGTSLLFAPFKGGVMVPDADLLFGPLTVAVDGTLELAAPWPAGIPSGFLMWLQAWLPDAGGPAGFAASNGLAIEAR